MPYIVGNMEFKSKGQAQRAMKELDIIDQIESSADISDPVLAEQLFVQFRANGAFKTKLGLNFLAQLQRTAGIDASEWDSAQHAEAKLSPLKAVLIVLIVVILVCAAVVAALSYFGRDGIENQNRTSLPVGMWVFFDRKPTDTELSEVVILALYQDGTWMDQYEDTGRYTFDDSKLTLSDYLNAQEIELSNRENS